ncbi:MAG: hypothetical protein AB7O49_05305 [Sphingomonadales bacterium]
MHIDALGASVSTDARIRPGTVFKCDFGNVSGTFLKAEVADEPETIWLVHLDSESGMPEFFSPSHLHPDHCLVFPDATIVLREFTTPRPLGRDLIGSVIMSEQGVAVYAASHANPTFDGHVVDMESGRRAMVAPGQVCRCPSWAIYPAQPGAGREDLTPLVSWPRNA